MERLHGWKRLAAQLIFGRDFVEAADVALYDDKLSFDEVMRLAAVAYAAILRVHGNKPSDVEIISPHTPSESGLLKDSFSAAGFKVSS